jgi:hypothetical protein
MNVLELDWIVKKKSFNFFYKSTKKIVTNKMV